MMTRQRRRRKRQMRMTMKLRWRRRRRINPRPRRSPRLCGTGCSSTTSNPSGPGSEYLLQG